MRLKSVKLTHFRGYRATTVIPIDEAMAGFVGPYQAAQTAH
jgi:chromosome segregation ATPase